MLLTRSGLSIFGGANLRHLAGMLCAAGVCLSHRCSMPPPALMLGYGIGRIGCQISGDGDWGHRRQHGAQTGPAAQLAVGPDL
jgi:phosphatidylglycerol:prolipoprotein diacylglycerol transferase